MVGRFSRQLIQRSGAVRRLGLGMMALGALLVLTMAAGHALAADPVDTTPPTGTLTINDGSGLANSLDLALHVPATDDVGVVSVQVYQDNVPGAIIPYADTIPYTLDPDKGDWLYTLQVVWRDAAGNRGSSDVERVSVDRVAPVVGDIRVTGHSYAHSTSTLSVRAADGSELSKVRLSADGITWGPATDWASSIVYHYLDPADGGGPQLGYRPLYVEVADVAGNWSDPGSIQFFATVRTSLTVSPGTPTTGHTITLTPDYPDPVTLPAGAHCYWEVLWGDNQSLYYGNPDETYGHFTTYGPASQGFCKPLSFTLPWMPYRQMIVSYRAEVEGDNGETAVAEADIGTEGPAEPKINPVVGSTSRRITSSNIPMAYVLPDDYTLQVGKPTTYRLYTVGGDIKITSKDSWSANFGRDRFIFQWGGTAFTFTPRWTGYVNVVWNSDTYRAKRWSASYDPRVRHPDATRPNTSAPVQHIASGTFDGKVPVKLTWSGSDVGWGISTYRLERSIDGGAWKRVLLKKTTTLTQSLAPGHRYRYRVRAIDKAGNRGYWDYGPTFRVRKRGDASASIRYSSQWSKVADATAFGGAVHESASAGSRATFTFKGRDVAWVAERGPTHGKASVYVDGHYLKTIDLRSSTDSPRRIVFHKHWRSFGAHTIRIVVQATSGRPVVDVDELLFLR